MNFLRHYLDVLVMILMGAGAVWGIEESIEFIDVNQKKALLYFQFLTLIVGIRFLVEIVLAGMKSLPGFFPELLVTAGSLVCAYEAQRASALKRTVFYLLAIGFMFAEYRLF
ncbi:MAG: hypothetical protein ABEK50_15110 [bacterium]